MLAQDSIAGPARRLALLLTPHHRLVGLAAASTVAACILSLAVPLLTQRLIDHSAGDGPLAALVLFGLALLAVFVGQAAIGWVTSRIMGRVGLDVARDLRRQLYARLQRLPLEYYDRTPAGKVIARVMDDVSAVQAPVTAQAVAVLTDLGTSLVVSAYLLWQWPRLFLAAIGFVPVYLLLFRGFGRRIRTGSADVRARLDAIFGHLKEKIDGILVVKVHGREAAEVEEFAGRIEAAHAPRVRVGRLGVAFSAQTATLGGIAAACVFAAGGMEVIAGRMSPGELVSAACLAALLFGPLSRLADLANIVQQAAASMNRLGDVLDHEPIVAEPMDAIPLDPIRGRVEFDQLGFEYTAGCPVLRDIRLIAEPGSTIALVGATGCGKSTLLSLLLRFYDLREGEIRVDGISTARVSAEQLRRQIGVVPQEAVVFRGTLADNIRYGCPDASDARVEEAARAALVHEFATQLPDGYQTLVGEGGHKLSQGQRQRVAIARALCIDPAIVVLDEATSALDPASEAKVHAALRNLLRGRTAFIIAHRLMTVRDADRIVVLEDGRIVQTGTHETLLADTSGPYRRLYERQFGTPPAEAVPRRRVTDTKPAMT